MKDIKRYDPNAFVQKISAATPFVRRGLPDIYACINGVSWWFEVKVAPNKLTSTQEACIDDMVRAGCNVGVLSVKAHSAEFGENPSRWTLRYSVHKDFRKEMAGGLITRFRGDPWRIKRIVEKIGGERND